MSWGPIFGKELKAEARGRRIYLVRAVAAATVAAFVGSRADLFRALAGFETLSSGQVAGMAERAVEAYGDAQLVLVLAIVPALVAGSIAEESARGTLGLLLAGRMGSAAIVGGKLASRLWLVLVMMLAGLPVLTLFGMLGGVDPERLADDFVAAVASAWFVAGLSILVSVHARSAAGAVMGAYAATIGWAVLPYRLAVWILQSGVPSGLEWLSPIARGLARSSPLSIPYPPAAWGVWGTGPGARPWMIREMAALQAVGGLALFLLAAWRLRPAYRARLEAKPNRLRAWLGRRAGLRGRPRPPVGDDPIGWKEAHAPESAAAARIVVLVGMGLVAYSAINNLTSNLAHRQHAMDELLRYGLDPGPWGIHLQARNGMNYVLNEEAAFLAGVAMAASALIGAAGVAGERARGTWDGLLSTPLDRGAILRAKMLGAARTVRPLLAMAVFIYTLSMVSTALHPIGFVLATASLAVFVWFSIALGTYISTGSRDPSRAIARTLVTLLAIELAPVAALAPAVGGYAASLAAAPRLLLELPLSRMRVHMLMEGPLGEPAVWAVFGVVVGIVAAHGLGAWLLTRAAARRVGREAG